MLVVTEAAAEAIGELTVQSDLPETAGLRISSLVHDHQDHQDHEARAWAAELIGGPGPQDEVMVVRQGRLYLEPAAADLLEDRILDAESVEDGDVVFHVRRQADA